MERIRLSHSEAVNRRRILAATRQAAVFDVNEKITERNQAGRRLAQIEELLSPDNQSLSILNAQELEQTRTGLEIERIWLQFKFSIITTAEKQQLLTSKFDELEQANPDVYQWLFSENEHGLSMAQRIRDKVIPPIRVAGYYTKR